jgi:hypothetical protein
MMTKKTTNTNRNSRTRTLIQLGGLLDLTPLLSICEIKLGDDLQLVHRDKAASLLGILAVALNQLPDDIEAEDLEKFRSVGLKLLNQRGHENV